ncbi:MAG: hypothetical protein NT075_05485 [Chloroflexi bacterium]|nr:hypothetical protein [Chloroflexota bacterium]
MKTRFYDRTAYRLSEQLVPNCFMKLDEHFDECFSAANEATTHISVLLAESVCGRMADLEMYAFLIEDARKRHGLEKDSDVRGAILTRSFLLGYLGVSRVLLESSAITLAILYKLTVNHTERSFSNGDFWHQLVTAAPNVHRRYHPMRLFLNEVWRWNNEAVLRVPPLMVSHQHFGQFSSREMHLRALDDPAVDFSQVLGDPTRLNWIDPLHLHDRWKPKLLALCEKICVDIEACT